MPLDVVFFHSHTENVIGTVAVYDPTGPQAARAHADTEVSEPPPASSWEKYFGRMVDPSAVSVFA